MSKLNQPLGKKSTQIAKRGINLVSVAKKSSVSSTAVLVVVLAVVLLGAVGKFGILDRYMEIRSLEHTLEETQLEEQRQKDIKASLAPVENEFIIYGYSYLTKEEEKLQTRVEILNMVEACVFPYGSISNMAINGNTVKMTAYNMTLADFTLASEAMTGYTDSFGQVLVESVKLDTSRNDGGGNGAGDTCTFTINLKDNTIYTDLKSK